MRWKYGLAIMGLIGLSFVAGGRTLASPQGGKAEYTVIAVPVAYGDDALARTLNKHAAEGWELVGTADRQADIPAEFGRKRPAPATALILRRDK